MHFTGRQTHTPPPRQRPAVSVAFHRATDTPPPHRNDPPSRSRHYVSNVRILGVEGDEITLEAAFHLYRSRLNSEEDNWYGRRVDVLRRGDGGFRLARRHLFLDQTVILSANLSTIF